MSTGPRTQATFMQGSQRTAEQDASHSALFYLFQEVSRLTSPIHNSFVDKSSPTKWPGDASRRDHRVVQTEEEDPQLFQTFTSSCQHSLSGVLPRNRGSKAKEESHRRVATTLVDPHCEFNSPWKVLSLINLQCERLLHRKDVEEPEPTRSQSSASPPTKFGLPAAKSSTSAADVTEERVGSDSVNVLNTLRSSLIIHKEHASVTHKEDARGGVSSYKSQCSVEDTKVACGVQLLPAEKTHTVLPELVMETEAAASKPQHWVKREAVSIGNRHFELSQEYKKEDFPTGQNIFKVHFSDNALSRAHMPSAPHYTTLTLNSNENRSVIQALSKPTLTLDCNANVVLNTEPPCDSQPGASCPAERCHWLPQKENKITGSPPESTNASLEEKSQTDEQLSSTGYNSASVKLQPELSPVQRERIAPPTSQQWRTKTPRKQPHPSRSVNIQDADIQGVAFRMGTELDDSREQCRLLITSEYSKELFKCTRKPRLRTRTSLKSLKTGSSDEESDPTTTVYKGKVCASCCTRKTPMWRDAEDGTPLCNACGIRYKKYRVRCGNCWHIPRKEGNNNSCCLKCGNSVRLTSAQRKHAT